MVISIGFSELKENIGKIDSVFFFAFGPVYSADALKIVTVACIASTIIKTLHLIQSHDNCYHAI